MSYGPAVTPQELLARDKWAQETTAAYEMDIAKVSEPWMIPDEVLVAEFLLSYPAEVAGEPGSAEYKKRVKTISRIVTQLADTLTELAEYPPGGTVPDGRDAKKLHDWLLRPAAWILSSDYFNSEVLSTTARSRLMIAVTMS